MPDVAAKIVIERAAGRERRFGRADGQTLPP
jgi:hypothetical protein